MKITSYFIKHPVASIILNLSIILIGILCFKNIPVREYPNVILPKLMVETNFPNASSELVETSVTNILEDELAGVEGVDHISSHSLSNKSSIKINFLPNTSMDRALMAVRDAVNSAKPKLPQDAKEPAVIRESQNSGPPFMAICLESESMRRSELTHYANVSLKNAFRSLQGVSSVEIWGTPYTYKITLDHHALYNYGINADEIYDAIAKAGVSLPVGKYRKESPVTLNSELLNVEDFQNILVQNKEKPVFLKSLADIQLAENTENFRMKINGKPGLCMGINRSSDANPLDTSALVHQQVNQLQKTIPKTIKMAVALDQAEFVRSSTKNIESSIIEAIILVLIIVFLFLGNIRGTIIPIITIPISLIGSLIFLKVFGFSINIMTLLAMVLAVGLVVDDAIVVLENIVRHIENGNSPLNAAINGSKEIGFAIIAMTLTLVSVYAPIAFIGGITGQLFIEFAVALAGSVLISGVVAITLSPLMCSKLIGVNHGHKLPKIENYLEIIAHKYGKILVTIINYHKVIISILLLCLFVTAIMFNVLPKETAPKEDRSLIGVFIPSTPGKNIEHTEQNVEKVENIIKNIPEAEGSLTFVFDHGGSAILPLKPKNKRTRSSEEIVASLYPLMVSFPSADAWPWSWNTALPGLDDPSENSELSLVISTTDSYKDLLDVLNNIRNKAEEKKLFRSIYHDLKLDNLGYNIEVDKDVLAKLNLSEAQIAKQVEIFFSGNSSLEFKKDGIIYPITLESKFKPWNLEELYLTNNLGKRISLGSFTKFSNKTEPKELFHYNQMRAAKLKIPLNMEENIVRTMEKLYNITDEISPSAYKKNWTGIAKTYTEASSSTSLLFVLAILFIYAILAIQFDNFIDPLIIIFTVPLACSGAMLTMYLTGTSLNIYSQVGLITLIGLITKHGILIVEFANQLLSNNKTLLDAILSSAKLRIRPILMTTGAMIAGSIPLIISNSEGSEARHDIGIVLVSGLGIGTIFTLLVLPSLYYLVKSLVLKQN